MANCLVCDKSLGPLISFGKMPIANGFLTKEQFSSEYFFNCELRFVKNVKWTVGRATHSGKDV